MTATSVDNLLKCSNPSCAKLFQPEQGTFFRFRQSTPGPLVQRYWLCQSCSGVYTLNYVNGAGMQVVNRAMLEPFKSRAAAARTSH
jgi:hypothetical protein